MDQTRSPWMLGIGLVALTAGCAQVPLAKSERDALQVAPVYRVQQPAGTAAGQYAVGRIDLAEGRVDAAIQRFSNALRLDRGFVEAHNGLGVAYGQQGRFAEAADAFRAALVITPDAPHVLNNLGFAQLKAGQLDEAWVSLKRSLVLDSRNERTRENLELLASVRAATVAEAAAGAARAVSATADASPGPVAAPAQATVAAVKPAPAPATVGASDPAPARAELATTAPAPASESVPVPAPIFESKSVAAPIVASTPVAATAQAAMPVAEPAALAARSPAAVVATPMPASPASASPPLPPARETLPEPVARAVVKPVAAPTLASARPAYEIVVSRSHESALVQVAPNVYELRSGPSASTMATATAPAAPAVVTATPPAASATAAAAAAAAGVALAAPVQPLPAPVAAPTQPLPFRYLTVRSDAPNTVQASKRPVTTVSLAALDGIEVSNGVGIRNLAGRTARTLSRLGVTVARVSDYRLFGRQQTEIHYRNGHVGEAMAVRTTLPVGARLVQSSRLHPQVNVRLVVGKDLVQRQVAWLGTEGMTADAEDFPQALPSNVAQGKGVDLVPHAGKVARANLDNGWRYL